jgi:hypothetical protein
MPSDGSADGTERTGKPYKYTAEIIGRYETRHKAIGQATIAARERAERRYDTTLTPKGYRAVISRVYAYEPYICDYCHETFLHEEELSDHHPCSHWQDDKEVVRDV